MSENPTPDTGADETDPPAEEIDTTEEYIAAAAPERAGIRSDTALI